MEIFSTSAVLVLWSEFQQNQTMLNQYPISNIFTRLNVKVFQVLSATFIKYSYQVFEIFYFLKMSLI